MPKLDIEIDGAQPTDLGFTGMTDKLEPVLSFVSCWNGSEGTCCVFTGV